MPLNSYVTLGRSGLRVSPFTLGTMTFGEDHGWGCAPDEAADMLTAYLNRGGNSIDTANIYTNGHAEKIVGDYFAARPGLRERVVIGTKFFCNLHIGDPNGGGAGRKAVLHQLEDSLRRLRTDHVDIYWLHNYNPSYPMAPVDEMMRTLDDLVTAGKIRYVGLSDQPSWRIAEASVMAQFRGWAPVTAVQLEYSLLERTAEGESLPAAEAFGIGVMPWSPLRAGHLSGKHGSDRPSPDNSRSQVLGAPGPEDLPVIDLVNEIAAEAGLSAAAVALSWVHHRPGVSSTIIGARSVRQLLSNLDAVDVTLSADQCERLDQASAPRLNFPSAVNAHGAVLESGGATVDGRAQPVFPALTASTVRY